MSWLTNLIKGKQSSKNVAKERLMLVLAHDRANCSTELLEAMKNDILAVIAKYMDIEETEGLDISITRERNDRNENVPVLTANIPITKMKKQIDA